MNYDCKEVTRCNGNSNLVKQPCIATVSNLSNQITPYRWNCICAHKRSLFHQKDHIISRISYVTVNIKHIKHPWFGHSKRVKFSSENNLISGAKELQIWRALVYKAKNGQCSCDRYINSNITNLQLKIYVEMNQRYKWFEPLPYRLRLLAVYRNTISLIGGIGLRCTFL